MPKTLRLNIPVLLPHAPDVQDGCVGRLIALLRAEPGVSEAHVAEGEGGPELCIHYDPDQLSLAQVRRRARQAGAEVSERFGHLVGRVEGVRHARHARTSNPLPGATPGAPAPTKPVFFGATRGTAAP